MKRDELVAFARRGIELRLAELVAEAARLKAAVAALSDRPAARPRPRRRKRSKWTAERRKAHSEMMKRRWAEKMGRPSRRR
jgi:hypothetical protein